jgi:hypothetical protein
MPTIIYDINLKENEAALLGAFEADLQRALSDRPFPESVRWVVKLDPQKRTVYVLEAVSDSRVLALFSLQHIETQRSYQTLSQDLRSSGEYPQPLVRRIAARASFAQNAVSIFFPEANGRILLRRRDGSEESISQSFRGYDNLARALEFCVPHFQTLQWRALPRFSHNLPGQESCVNLIATDGDYEIQLLGEFDDISENDLTEHFQGFMNESEGLRYVSQLP